MLPVFLQIIFVSAASLIGGSFASALSWRIPREERWGGKERSRCPSCGATLAIRDLIPLFSWLLMRGHCRHCGAPISNLYPLIELSALAAGLGLWAAWGWDGALLFLLAAVPFLIAHIVIDARLMILPDQINFILAVIFALFVLYQSFTPQFSLSILMAGLGAGIVYPALMLIVGTAMKALLGKDALGWGDIKFFAVAGLGLGFIGLPAFLMLSGLFGVATGLFWRWHFKSALFPFGPAIILAFYAGLLLRGAGLDGFLTG